MYRLVSLVLLLSFASNTSHADDAGEARAVLDKAIKAVGGTDNLVKHQGITWKSSGFFSVEAMKITFTDDWSVQARDKFRWNLTINVEGNTIAGGIGIDGGKGWLQAGANKPEDLTKEQYPLLSNEFRILRMIDLLNPLTEKTWKLSHLGELNVNDKPAIGIKAATKDLPEIDLYFDKESGLPVRCEFRVKEPERSDEALHSYYFSEFKEFDGRKHFTKLILKRDDKAFMEMERTDVKLVDKVDDSMFAKP